MSIQKFIVTEQHLQQLEHLVVEFPTRYRNIVDGICAFLRTFEPLVEDQKPDAQKPE